jgi:alpha-1,3-glucan synthase
LVRGEFNTWGFDKGISSLMQQKSDGLWELEVGTPSYKETPVTYPIEKIMASWPSYVQLNVFTYDDYFYGDTDGDAVLDRLPPNSAGMM